MKKYTKWGVLLLVLALVLSFAVGCNQEAQQDDDDVEGGELLDDAGDGQDEEEEEVDDEGAENAETENEGAAQ